MAETLQKRDIDIICGGHAAVDIIPRFPADATTTPEEMFKPGRLINVDEADVVTGGSAPNTGIALKRLGMNVALLIRVGNDHFGRIARDIIEKAGIKEAINVVQGDNSSYTIVISPPGFDRMFFHSPGANDNFSSEDIKEALLERTRLFHLGYPPLMRNLYVEGGRELAKVFQRAKDAGAITSLDFALPDPNSPAGKVDWGEVLGRTLPFVDIFIPSVEEAMFCAQRDKCDNIRKTLGNADFVDSVDGSDCAEIAEICMKWGARIIVLKCGHKGYYIQTAHACQLNQMKPALVGKMAEWAGREIWIPPYKAEYIASATGSGDCSIAGFLAAYLKGESPERAALFANAVGCQNLAAMDAVSGVLGWKETVERVNNTTAPRLDFKVDSPGWRQGSDTHSWIGPKDTV